LATKNDRTKKFFSLPHHVLLLDPISGRDKNQDPESGINTRIRSTETWCKVLSNPDALLHPAIHNAAVLFALRRGKRRRSHWLHVGGGGSTGIGWRRRSESYWLARLVGDAGDFFRVAPRQAVVLLYVSVEVVLP
jgi:hypothetical protein